MLLALVAVLLLPACETQRTVKSVKPGNGGYSLNLDDKAWSQGKGGTATEAEKKKGKDKITAKFVNAGFKKDEETGVISVANNNLYAGKNSRMGNKSFRGQKEARVRGRDVAKKAFKTPEYLKRSSFKGASKSARETGMLVNEDSDNSSKFGRNIGTKEAGFLKQVNPFARKKFRGSSNKYTTFSNRDGSRALANAPMPKGVPRSVGFTDQTKMSVDDVKKMLNPNAYANARGL